MLELKHIQKDYLAGENTVHALKGIDLQFRSSEFVSILGPSGCGKTTMLNIIGGLDQYTDGDLLINGKTTRDFQDRDWDRYRNHTIGFVFQSYNLIPHQTVLQNVELALTLSGVSKAERKKRAVQALEEVGLGNQLRKKPSEMSGGQMQRVAIARALVNNPDIILADEPTGALDTETSVQVMEILKRISKDRLIIMVTHNPELAATYSSRIIRMLDGQVTDDSAPLSEEEVRLEVEKDNQAQRQQKVRMPSMSFATSFSLSLKNLFTKKGRTALTSFAGSIGIIGIALVLSISQGFTAYIDAIQEETLSSYPLTIEKTNTDLTSLMEAFMQVDSDEVDHPLDAVYVKPAIYDIVDAMNNMDSTENDLKSFKTYLEEKDADSDSDLHKALNGMQYSYNFDLLVYTKNTDGKIIRSDTTELLQELMLEYMNVDVSSMMTMQESFGISSDSTMMSMFSGGASSNLWEEMLSGDDGAAVSDVLKDQYDVVYGDWPHNYDEIVLVLDENNELNDMALYALGLTSEEEAANIIKAATNQEELKRNDSTWSYEDICNMEFKTILNADCYSYDETTGLYQDLRETDAGLQYLYDNGLTLKVTGIIRPNEDTTAPMLNGSIGYTSDLTAYVVEHAKDSDAIAAQLEQPSVDILTGLPFQESTGDLDDAGKAEALREYIDGLNDTEKAAMYVKILSVPSEETLATSVAQATEGKSREEMETAVSQAMLQQMSMSEEELSSYLQAMDDEELESTYTQLVTQQIQAQYAQEAQQQTASMQPAELVAALNAALPTYTEAQCALYYDNVMEFSDSTYEDNLSELGYVDLEDPSAINLYAASFEDKDLIEDAIAAYNADKEEYSKIQYTDYVGLMMSSVTTIIHTITYVLIAFIAISLVVSSIMIGVITLISVQERTKEIGILRAIGASKRNVSSMFNAETLIIGFGAGAIGVIVTYLLCIPINLIIHQLTGIQNLNAVLPVSAALVLLLISMLLTLLSGLIPSRSAAKKDPVVALRSE